MHQYSLKAMLTLAVVVASYCGGWNSHRIWNDRRVEAQSKQQMIDLADKSSQRNRDRCVKLIQDLPEVRAVKINKCNWRGMNTEGSSLELCVACVADASQEDLALQVRRIASNCFMGMPRKSVNVVFAANHPTQVDR